MCQTLLRIVMMLFLVSSFTHSPYCTAQLTGHPYAITILSSGFLFKKAWSYLNPTKKKDKDFELSNFVWELLCVVCLYRSFFNKSDIPRSGISSYVTPLIPNIGGMFAGALVVALLDQRF